MCPANLASVSTDHAGVDTFGNTTASSDFAGHIDWRSSRGNRRWRWCELQRADALKSHDARRRSPFVSPRLDSMRSATSRRRSAVVIFGVSRFRISDRSAPSRLSASPVTTSGARRRTSPRTSRTSRTQIVRIQKIVVKLEPVWQLGWGVLGLAAAALLLLAADHHFGRQGNDGPPDMGMD